MTAAEALDRSKDVGAIAVAGNPLDDVSILQKVRVVIKGGQVVKN